MPTIYNYIYIYIYNNAIIYLQATDMSFLEKCHFHHDSNKLYEKPRMSDPVFYVHHYAGRIKYNVSSYQTLQIRVSNPHHKRESVAGSLMWYF